MKDKVPKITLRISIAVFILLAVLLNLLHEQDALLALLAVISLSVVYLGGMEKNHEKFMRKGRH